MANPKFKIGDKVKIHSGYTTVKQIKVIEVKEG